MKKIFKSAVAVILCAALLCGTAVISFAGGDTLKIAVATDIHFSSFSDLGEFPADPEAVPFTEGLLNKETYAYASIQGRMDWESKAIIKQLLKEFADSDDELLLIAGDLTSSGKRQSHLELAEILRNAEAESGKEIFVIGGNHDFEAKGSEGITIDEFKEIYADFGYNEALSVHETSGSYTADLSGNYRLIAVDSCIYGEVGGEINHAVLSWIRKQAEKAKLDGKKLIAMMHHPLLPHFAVQPLTNSGSYSQLLRELSDLGIDIVFTGHIHANDISSAKTLSGKTIYDVMTGSLIVYPHAYRHAEFGGEKVKITSDYITEIDTADLTEGYTAEQLQMIENNFPEYSQGFFEAGMCRWLNKYVGSAEKVGGWLGLKKGTKAFDELNRLMNAIGKAISLPIYDDGSGDDSIEKFALEAGFTLPESDYERPYQIVAAVMSNFYYGDEREMESETELVFLCLKAIVLHFGVTLASDAPVGSLLNFLGIRLDEDFSLSGEEFPKVVTEKSLQALLTALLGGITEDYSEPSDINAELDTSAKAPDISLISRIVNFLLSVFKAFSKLFINL